MIQVNVATSTSPGSMAVDGRVNEPKEFMHYLEFDPSDFEAHWQAVNLSDALLDRALPTTVESVVLQEVFKLNANYLEKAFWQSSIGGTAPFNKWDGMVTKMLADATVIPITSANYAALSAANIVAKLGLVRDAIPEALIDDPNMKLFVSKATAKLYDDAQKAQTNKGVDITQRGIRLFDGYQVVALPGVPANTIIAAKGTASLDSNLWMGVNSVADENRLDIMRLQANSELFFVKGLFKVDVNFGWGEEVVLYHPSNA